MFSKIMVLLGVSQPVATNFVALRQLTPHQRKSWYCSKRFTFSEVQFKELAGFLTRNLAGRWSVVGPIEIETDEGKEGDAHYAVLLEAETEVSLLEVFRDLADLPSGNLRLSTSRYF